MKDTFYFSHDYNSRADEKIKKLIRSHGMKGYGIFWSIVEDLYNNANALPADYEGIAYDLRVEEEIVKSIISDFELFVIENESFGSTSIERRLDERNEKSEKARQSAFKRWDKIKADANALRTHNDSNAIKESIGKYKKGKKEKNINPLPDAFSTDYIPVNGFDSIAFKLWKQCYDNRIEKKIKPTLLQKAKPSVWTKEIRLLIDNDNRTEAEVGEVLNFLKNDCFWSNNIQSPDKLRKQFERLQLEMKKPGRTNGAATHNYSKTFIKENNDSSY